MVDFKTLRLDIQFILYYGVTTTFIISILSYMYNVAFKDVFKEHYVYLEKLEARIEKATTKKVKFDYAKGDIYYIFGILMMSIMADIVSILLIMYTSRSIIRSIPVSHDKYRNNNYDYIMGITSVLNAPIIMVYFSLPRKMAIMRNLLYMDPKSVFIPIGFTALVTGIFNII